MKPDEKSKRNLFEIIENIDLLVDEHIKISELWTLKDIYTKILKNLNQVS